MDENKKNNVLEENEDFTIVLDEEHKEEETKSTVKDDNSSKIDEIENDILTIEDKFGIDSNIETQKEEIKDEEKKLYEIENQLQMLDVELDSLDMKMQVNEDAYYEHIDEYKELKNKQKALLKERKEIIKGTKNQEERDLNNLSIWIIFYGLFITIINLPFVSYELWLKFATWIISIFENVFSKIKSGDFLYYPIIALLMYALPIILNIITLELYLNFVKPKKNKTDKLVFAIVWILQGALTIFMMIYLGIEVFKGL